MFLSPINQYRATKYIFVAHLFIWGYEIYFVAHTLIWGYEKYFRRHRMYLRRQLFFVALFISKGDKFFSRRPKSFFL